MTHADYASTHPSKVALIAKRASIIDEIKKYVPNIKVFCKDHRLSTATFYRIWHGKYVSDKTWEKMIRLFCQTVTLEEFLAYIQEYYRLYALAFTDEPSASSAPVKTPSRTVDEPPAEDVASSGGSSMNFQQKFYEPPAEVLSTFSGSSINLQRKFIERFS